MSARTVSAPPSPISVSAQLAEAGERCYRWPGGLASISATVLVHVPEDVHVGRVQAHGPHRVAVSGRIAASSLRFVEDQVGALVRQHWPGRLSELDAAAEITAAPDEPNHPLGVRVVVANPLRSTFRVRDGRITEVIRHAPGAVIRVSMLAWTTSRIAGVHGELPAVMHTSYADPVSGALISTETTETSWVAAGDVMVPAHRRVVRQDAAGCLAREVEFVEHAVALRSAP